MTISGKRFIEEQNGKRTQVLESEAKQLTGGQSTLDIPASTAKEISEPQKELSLREKINKSAAEMAQKGIDMVGAGFERLGAEIEAAAATKFTQSADVVQKKAEDIAEQTIKENIRAQQAKSGTELKASRMLGDSDAQPDPEFLGRFFSPFKTGFLSKDQNFISLTNGKSTVTKPIIKTIDYDSVLGQAYDTVTYKAANEGIVMSVQELDELFPEYKDVPTDQKQLFINECLYDVQQNKKRELSEFADFFGSMSMKEGYVNQQDATIQYMTDPEVMQYSLGGFLNGQLELEGRTPEQIQEFVQAAYTIKGFADAINEQGYNLADTPGWVVVKSFEDDYPELKQAIDTFNKFGLTQREALKINNTYERNLRTQNQLVNDLVYGGEVEYRDAIKQFKDQYLQQFHKDFVNSYIKEIAQEYQQNVAELGESAGDFEELVMWLYQDYYEMDGKYYDKNGNEILPSEGRNGYLNRVAEGLIDLAGQVETLGFDTVIANKAWQESEDTAYNMERTLDVVWDGINVAFGGMMNFTGGGQLFQFATTLGRAGAKLDMMFAWTMERIGEMAIGMADMIGFADGWSESSKEKYRQAMEGLGIMAIGRVKSELTKRGKIAVSDYISDTALIKAIKQYVAQIVDGIEIRDEKDMRRIIEEKGKPVEEKTTEEKVKVEEKPGEEKIEEKKVEVKGKGETPKTETTEGKKYLKPGTIENAKKTFNEILSEEIQKNTDVGKNPKLIDTLFQAAAKLTDSLFKREETKGTTVEEAPEIKKETTTEQTAQPTEVITPEKPIETEQPTETKPIETVETTEGVAETEQETSKEVRTTIAKILDVMKAIQDNAKEVVEKIKNRRINKESKQRIDYYVENKIFDKETAELMENSPFSEKVLDIINNVVAGDYRTSIFGRKKAPKKTEQTRPEPSTDEIQRDVLSEGMKKLQEAWDRLHSIRKTLGKLYDYLSKEETIDTIDFIKGEELANLLSDYGFKIDIVTENGKLKAEVNKIEDVDIDEKYEAPIKKYVEHFINDILRFEMKSEKDVKSNRSSLTWNESTFGDRNSAFENSFREAFNAFLDRTGNAELLRKIDAEYHNLKENLDTISMLFDKDGNVRNKAKNEILKREDAELDQLEYYIPGIKDLVRLTKAAPKIVKKGIDVKYSYKPKRDNLSKIVRYTFVYGGSIAAAFVSPWIAPIAFSGLEILGNKAKKIIQGKTPDWEVYDKMVESLKIDGSKKSELKRKSRERYDELSKEMEGEAQEKIQKIMEEATQILIDREAAKRMEQKAFRDEIEQRRIERENREKQSERERQQQPIENALPGMKPDVATAEGEITLGIGNPINPETLGSKGVKQQPKPIKEVKETYKDKEKTQQGYTQQDKIIIEASLGKDEGQTYDPKAEKVADILESQLKDIDNATRDSAINSLEEKGEDVTEENIQKEKNAEPSSIEEFIMEAEKGAPEERTNYDGADIKDLEEVVANPKKYPNVDIEAAKTALEKARRQNTQAEIMQSPDQQQAQREIAGIYKGNQMEREGNKGREKQREDMVRETNRDFDTLETTEEYDRIESQITPEEGEQAQKYAKGYKGFYRSDKAKTDELRADMGKKPSQNITYTSSADKIATLENPKSRARVAQDRLNKRKRLSKEEKTQLNQIIEQANVEIQAKEELKTQKTDLANEYKRLEKKRSETPYRETKKEITKQMDKVSKEFDKVEMEEWEAEREVAKMGYEENMEIEKDVSEIENETQQTTEVEIEDKKEIDRKERELEAKTVSTIRKSSIDEGIQEAIDKGVAEEKKEMTELIKSGKIDKGKKYEMVVERKYNKFGDTVERGDIKPIEIDLENAPDALFELSKYVEKGNNISLKYWNGNNKNIIRSTQGRGETTNIEGFKKRYENNKTLSEETNKQGKETKTDKLSMDDLKGDAPIETKNKVTDILNDTTDNIVENIQKGKSVKETSDKNIYGQEVPKDIKDRAGEGVLKNNKGELVPIFHGSNSKFTIEEFDENRAVSGLGGTNGGFGMFFAIRYEYAEGAGKFITDRKKGETNVMECYSNIKNPILHPQYIVEKLSYDPVTADTLLMDYYRKVGRMDYLDEIHDFAESEGYESLVDALGDKLLMEGDQWRNAEFRGDTVKEKQILQKLGYDSIIFSEENFTIAIFDPKKNVKQTNQETGKSKGGDKPEEPTTPKKPEPNKPTGGTPLVDVAKDGTVNKEPGIGDYTTDQIQKRIDELKKKRQDNGKKLYAQDLSELRVLQDLLTRQIERENREQGTEATEEDLDRRENLAPAMGGIQQSGKGESED